MERINNLMEKLIDEQRRQTEHVNRVMARLRAEKDSWFLSRSAKLAKNETITTFLQLCLFPRCIFTANEAIYCAKFVEVIHSLKTPNFSTLICFDRIFCDITYTVTSCTENEAHRYGRFLAAMLDIVMRWHKSREIFESECVGFPGFVTKFRVATNDTPEDAKNSKDHVDYENYRHVVHKWHFKIAKALVVCLESKDYVQIRNALTILTKILPHFPVIAKLNGVIEKRIEKVCNDEKESRKDLYIKAMSYSGQLRNRKNSVLKEHEFHQVGAKGEAEKNAKEEEVNVAAASATTNNQKKVTLTTSANKETKETSNSRDSNSRSRSQSHEKSLSRSNRDSTSEDRKAAKGERESKSKDRTFGSSKDKRREEDRNERGRSRDKTGEMGPPQSTAHHRRSVEPSEERESSKKRKPESADETFSEKKSRREKSETQTSPTSSSQAKRDKKSERKRDRDDVEPAVYEEKRKRPDSEHEDSSRSSKSAQNGDADRKSRGSSSSASSSSRHHHDSKRK